MNEWIKSDEMKKKKHNGEKMTGIAELTPFAIRDSNTYLPF